ncbi:hypothetical protein BDZ88DRAFT_310313 [Geranomyces variabilis]|nr:hypothetical protein BDZ88DRAFT_310313 [Geranomyces variabilis]
MSVFSVIPHKDEKSRPRRRRTRSFKYFGSDYFEKIKLNVDIDAIKRRKFAQSFGTLLEPALTLEPKSAENSLYHPFFLDDPELRTGKHRTVITLPCFVSSIIQHSKPSDIKKELNERFRETHPTVNPTLTLTQIRRLKERLQKIAEMQNLELSSVACSYVYFEKLNMVSKESRRLVAAVCLLLAAKVNDPKELDYTKLLDSFEKVLDISRKDVLANEFLIYTALEFTLYIPLWEVMPHLERIIEASVTKLSMNMWARIIFSFMSTKTLAAGQECWRDWLLTAASCFTLYMAGLCLSELNVNNNQEAHVVFFIAKKPRAQQTRERSPADISFPHPPPQFPPPW